MRILPRLTSRVLAALIVGLGASTPAPAGSPGILSRPKPPAPSEVVPLHLMAPEFRASVAEVVSEPSFHHKGTSETFPCHPRLYLNLLNEPALTLALWQDLSTSPARLQAVGPGRYQGTDGAGTTATWQYVFRSPRLHVLLCDLDYRSPRGTAQLQGRIVLVVRSGYFKEVNGDPWVQHDIEAFVKIDSKGWRAVAKTIRPLIERLLVDQIQEAGWFVSLMGRLVESYPDWATEVVLSQPQISPEARQEFQAMVAQARRPDASPGRPTLVEESSTGD